MSDKKVFSPIKVDLEKDRKYGWCTCGHTKNEPFCDGSHKEHSLGPSLKFSVAEEKTAHLCTCKQTKNPPYCDGTHKNL